jgi:hypothetical protein
MNSPAATEPAGATLLRPKAITRADPITPWASPRPSSLLALKPSPPLPLGGLTQEPAGQVAQEARNLRSKPVIRMILTSEGLGEISRNSQPACSA